MVAEVVNTSPRSRTRQMYLIGRSVPPEVMWLVEAPGLACRVRVDRSGVAVGIFMMAPPGNVSATVRSDHFSTSRAS